jgi:pyridoxine 4-dehydrogenase
MGMSELYGKADRTESIATIRAALDAGINLIDTGDFYGSGHNELLIREALTGRTREASCAVSNSANAAILRGLGWNRQ